MKRKFNGTLRINPIHIPSFEVTTEWEYDSEMGCWYGNGESFPVEICDIVEGEWYED